MQRAAGYGVASESVDGNDPEAVFAAVLRARTRALDGGGPTLIEAITMRMHGHGAHDDARYASDLVAEWAERDPLARYRTLLESEGLDVAAIEARVDAMIAAAVEAALQAPMPDPATATQGSLRKPPQSRWGPDALLGPATARSSAAVAVKTYLQAITQALAQEMERDESVVLLGEDIGSFGGAFKVTDGLQEKFGADRVRDTPIAEAGIVGTAVGAAITGMRPVCEMQFADFVACGFDQIVNVAAKMHYRLGLAVPMTIRLPSGGGSPGVPFTRRTRRRGSCTLPA